MLQVVCIHQERRQYDVIDVDGSRIKLCQPCFTLNANMRFAEWKNGVRRSAVVGWLGVSPGV